MRWLVTGAKWRNKITWYKTACSICHKRLGFSVVTLSTRASVQFQIFLRKIVIFHTKYPKNFRATLREFFKCALPPPLTWNPGSAPEFTFLIWCITESHGLKHHNDINGVWICNQLLYWRYCLCKVAGLLWCLYHVWAWFIRQDKNISWHQPLVNWLLGKNV